MATYSNLSYGSSGDEVKKLQQSLINAGYDLGGSGADGVFGDLTQAAVKKYQQDNGLDVDGIAGTNTLGKLYGTTSTGTTQSTQNTQQTTQTTPKYTIGNVPSVYDSAADAAYQQALAALQQASKETPTYAGTYDTQLEELYKQITNRDKFSYDLNGDMLYQQYKDQYTNLGQMAMKDTMGQAAALTGGYGSSYSQGVGQQAYQGYLQQLNEVVPELYGMALDQYNQQGQDLLNQYGMIGDLRDDEYGKYQDQLNQYWLNVDYLKGQADDAYNRGYTEWSTAYATQQDAYNKLLDQMTKSGYMPTAEELAYAGMTQAQADAYIKAWKASNPDLAYRTGAITANEYKAYTGAWPAGYTPPSSGGGGGGGGGGSYYNSSTAALQQQLIDAGYNISKDGIMGPETQAALNAYNASQKTTASYNFGELMDAAASGMSKSQIETTLANRGVDTSKPGVQADIKKALSK